MKQTLKLILHWLRWTFAVIGLLWVLVNLFLILLYESVIISEPNMPLLIVEIVLIGFALILQFIPLKD